MLCATELHDRLQWMTSSSTEASGAASKRQPALFLQSYENWFLSSTPCSSLKRWELWFRLPNGEIFTLFDRSPINTPRLEYKGVIRFHQTSSLWTETKLLVIVSHFVLHKQQETCSEVGCAAAGPVVSQWSREKSPVECSLLLIYSNSNCQKLPQWLQFGKGKKISLKTT